MEEDISKLKEHVGGKRTYLAIFGFDGGLVYCRSLEIEFCCEEPLDL